MFLFENYIDISALETASQGNGHCASCIGALSFPAVAPPGGKGGSFPPMGGRPKIM